MYSVQCTVYSVQYLGLDGRGECSCDAAREVEGRDRDARASGHSKEGPHLPGLREGQQDNWIIG